MKKSNRLDVVCIDLILKYIGNLREAYDTYNITSKVELKRATLCHLAVTQLITNIYQSKQKMSEKIIDDTPIFSRLQKALKAARNIASHEYGELNFGLLHELATELLAKDLIEELEAIKDALKHNS